MKRLLAGRCECRFGILLAVTLLVSACAGPWIAVPPGQRVYSFADIPVRQFQRAPEDHVGTVIEDRFKFYRIYHDRDTYDPARREQVIEGHTHFTARTVRGQNMIQVLITPAQEAYIRKRGIRRQDVVRARVRFAGIAPGQALAFELMEILDSTTRKP